MNYWELKKAIRGECHLLEYPKDDIYNAPEIIRDYCKFCGELLNDSNLTCEFCLTKNKIVK